MTIFLLFVTWTSDFLTGVQYGGFYSPSTVQVREYWPTAKSSDADILNFYYKSVNFNLIVAGMIDKPQV